VARLFRERGEAFFRQEERRLAVEIAETSRLVVAAGGGAFAFPDTREALSQAALTVWLRCDLETVLGRVRLDGSRPLAADRETIVRLFRERESSYRLADCEVDASQPPQAVALQVLDRLRSRGAAPG